MQLPGWHAARPGSHVNIPHCNLEKPILPLEGRTQQNKSHATPFEKKSHATCSNPKEARPTRPVHPHTARGRRGQEPRQFSISEGRNPKPRRPTRSSNATPTHARRGARAAFNSTVGVGGDYVHLLPLRHLASRTTPSCRGSEPLE